MKLFSAFLTALIFGGVSWAQQPAASMRRFLDEFPNPDKQYRSAPLMVWNHEVTTHRLDAMLREFREQGIGGVFIHPRQGLVTPYLSDEWHRMVEYTVTRGRELGLDVWLYDENSYPSGFAGGYVPVEMPESYNQGQGLRQTVVEVMPHRDTISKYELILREKRGAFEEVTAAAPKMSGRKGKFYLYEKSYYKVTPWYAGTSYVDLLKPGVTEKFMEVTMRGYEKTLGPDLARSVKGIFTDEPEIVTSGGLRWTPDLFEQFRLMHGYDLVPLLPCLGEETGDWKRVRHDYFELLLHLFIERWAKPWYAYCEEKDLVWTGHYWEHNWPNVTGVTDNMAMAAWQQMPGIDMLFNTFDDEGGVQFGNIRAVKEVGSVANQLGRSRVLSETYGGGGWQVTFKDMKRLADWQFALGVNFVNQHIAQMSMLGIRKSDYPPFFYRSASWWGDYRLLGDYIARMSAATSVGEQVNGILVLEPTTSVWLYNNYASRNPEGARNIGKAFESMVTSIEKAQVEYDLGCEDIFKTHGSVEGGRFVVGRRGYHTFVVPPLTENIESETFALLKTFAEGGGTVVSLATPTRVDGVPSAEVETFFNSDRVVRADSLTNELIESRLRSADIRFTRLEGGNTYHQRRELGDGNQLLLLANVSLDGATDVSVELAGRHVVRMDALDGKTCEVPFRVSNGRVSLDMRVEPAETVLLCVTETPLAAEKPTVPGELTPLQPISPLKIERLKENVLVIDFLDLECGDETLTDVFYETATKAIFKQAGLENNPWWKAMQHKQEIVERDYSDAPGFTASYRFTVDARVDLGSMQIVVENPSIYTVRINGTEVGKDTGWMSDEDFKRIDIAQWVREGDNVVTLGAPHPSAYTELAAIYLLGDFNVWERDGKWVVTPTATNSAFIDWRQLGAPFYPWEMSYVRSYDVSDTSKRHWVEASRWDGSLVQVWVNGAKAGVIFAAPWRLDVTPFVKQGANSVELRVVGNMQNLLGPHHKPYDGIIGPWQFTDVDASRKSSEYHLSPFGLKADFIFGQER